jgi:tRNA(Arg) A34 adenosine deaminase TadA
MTSGTRADDARADAAGLWAGLDEPWQVAFGQAWEALRRGSIAVGACASSPDGQIVAASRNRVSESAGPPGEVFGSSLAHAETNVLARLPFRHRRELVLTTTLQPCLQCAAAIRLGPVAMVRFAGADRYWEGCHEFGRLSAREAARTQPERIGPRRDELGVFAAVISLLGPALTPRYEEALRGVGDGPAVDLALELRDGGGVGRLAAMDVAGALAHLWPRLRELCPVAPSS